MNSELLIGSDFFIPKADLKLLPYLSYDIIVDVNRKCDMSFQAYLDDIEEKTGKTPKELIAIAKTKGFDEPSTKAGEILAWLKDDFNLGRGHGMAVVHIIKHGDIISDKHVDSGSVHSDPSNKLNLDGKNN